MTTYTRHNEIQVLYTRPGTIEAEYYNQVQTALKRARKQIRCKIPGLNHLDLILQQDAWIVVDRVLNDIPIAAWTNFETQDRDNLHKPLPCEIRLYHFAARMILNKTLEAIDTILKQALAEQNNDNAEVTSVLPFNKDN